MMILDGYNLHGNVLMASGEMVRLVYRPMLSQERSQFLLAFRGWSERAAVVEKSMWLDRHVISADGSFGSMLDFYETGSVEDFRSLHHLIVGVRGSDGDESWTKDWEQRDVENIRRGLRTDIEHRYLSRRSCSDCLRFEWGPDSQSPLIVNGKKQPRTIDVPPLCHLPGGCPVGTPENPVGRLSQRNKIAFRHYRGCVATGVFPDDPIVARNAIVFRQTLQELGREPDGFVCRRGREGVGVGGGARNQHRVPGPAGGDFFFAGEPEF
jgi:hypothetical protein